MKYNFEKLEVWQLGMELVNEIYMLSKNFPASEKFTLTSQIKRAAISIPLNIAEESGKRTKKDFRSYVRNAIGSTLEVVTCYKIAIQQNYFTKSQTEKLNVLLEKIYFKLIGLEKSLN